jgi:hypothetical protein
MPAVNQRTFTEAGAWNPTQNGRAAGSMCAAWIVCPEACGTRGTMRATVRAARDGAVVHPGHGDRPWRSGRGACMAASSANRRREDLGRERVGGWESDAGGRPEEHGAAGAGGGGVSAGGRGG